MRIAFSVQPALGHLLPVPPLALAARDAGIWRTACTNGRLPIAGHAQIPEPRAPRAWGPTGSTAPAHP